MTVWQHKQQLTPHDISIQQQQTADDKKSHHNVHLVVAEELSYQGQELTFNHTFYANMG